MPGSETWRSRAPERLEIFLRSLSGLRVHHLAMTIGRNGLHALTIAVIGAAAAHVGTPARAAEGCDRACLRGFITRYLDAMVAHTPGALPVSPALRFTEDYVDLKL